LVDLGGQGEDERPHSGCHLGGEFGRDAVAGGSRHAANVAETVRPNKTNCAGSACLRRELLAVEPALYTFARVAGVEPTNNAAERALRHAVCWRKASVGTDSAGGSRFVERVFTVVAIGRQQRRDVLEYLSRCCEAARHGGQSPSLVPNECPQ